MTRITLLTDFGTVDAYVGAMKGVMATAAPDAFFDDVSHDVEQGDVAHARRVLGRYWKRYPPGTVHLVVVDPGVGTDRHPLAIEADGRFVVAPDNGVVSRVLDETREWRAVVVDNADVVAPEPSATFHGRDIFAPAAAFLAAGGDFTELGPTLSEPVRIHEPEPWEGPDGLEGVVVSVDRFGNLVTNVPGRSVPRGATVHVGGREVGLASAYGDVPEGTLLALVNSDGRLEVAVRNGSAGRRLSVDRGARVRVDRG